MIFNDEIDLHLLPAIWNRKYKDYLGLDVPDDASGILQDIHWSLAYFGYFPTYALGSAIGAQIFHHMRKEKKSILPDLIRDKNIKLTVTTGLEALGRGSELTKLATFFDIM